jgi:hypothetical protein
VLCRLSERGVGERSPTMPRGPGAVKKVGRFFFDLVSSLEVRGAARRRRVHRPSPRRRGQGPSGAIRTDPASVDTLVDGGREGAPADHDVGSGRVARFPGSGKEWRMPYGPRSALRPATEARFRRRTGRRSGIKKSDRLLLLQLHERCLTAHPHPAGGSRNIARREFTAAESRRCADATGARADSPHLPRWRTPWRSPQESPHLSYR